MTTKTTERDLVEEVEELLAKATPGRWLWILNLKAKQVHLEVTPSEESKENEMKVEMVEEEIKPTGESAETEIAEQGFTRGPWFTKWNGAYGHMVYGSDGSGSVVAVVSGVAPGITTAQGKANARLMAAAPALYDALRGLRRINHKCYCSTWVGGEHEPECEAARAALALVDNPQKGE